MAYAVRPAIFTGVQACMPYLRDVHPAGRLETIVCYRIRLFLEQVAKLVVLYALKANAAAQLVLLLERKPAGVTIINAPGTCYVLHNRRT